MKNIAAKLSVLLLLYAFNGQQVYANGSETGTITGIIVEGKTKISVWLDGIDYTDECAGGARWVIDTTDPLYKEKYSVVLSAAFTNKKVRFQYITSWGCDSSWNGNRVYYVAPVL